MDLTERVTRERRLRGWSARDAAIAGGVSNTTWSRFEAGGPIGDAIRQGVARAFGWSVEWPETPPPDELPPDELSRLRHQVESLADQVQRQSRQLGELMDVVAELRAGRGAAGSGS